MAKVDIFDLTRKSVGKLELSDDVFGASVNEHVLYEVVKAQLASRRSGTASTRCRAEVRGSTRKLYRQKGTGRARHGSIRAPIYVGGGQAHGPKPRDYGQRPPRKIRLGALRGALSLKLKQGQLLVLNDFQLEEIKTGRLANVLAELQVPKSALLVDRDNKNLRLSARNLASHQYLPPEGVNVYDLLRHEHLVVTKDAALDLQARCGGGAEA